MPISLNNTESDLTRNQLTSAQTEGLVRSAGVVSLAVFMSRITGLLRESVMAGLFGAHMVYDAFTQGFRIPNLTRDLFAPIPFAGAFFAASGFATRS